jgi:hypothetical protein
VRILFLSQFFSPEPFFKALPFATALARRGHEVEALTGFPNYPGGRLYPGYRVRPWQRETLEGIPITRVPLYPSHDRSIIRRTLTYTRSVSCWPSRCCLCLSSPCNRGIARLGAQDAQGNSVRV